MVSKTEIGAGSAAVAGCEGARGGAAAAGSRRGGRIEARGIWQPVDPGRGLHERVRRGCEAGGVIVASHMHVGEFPLFDVALDERGLVALFEEFDYRPFHDPGVELREVEASGLDEAAQRRVLGLTARKLFFGNEDASVSAPGNND